MTPSRFPHILPLLFLLISPAAAQADTLIDSAYVRQHYQKREAMIPMRDGVRLFTCIYEPKDKSTRHPILMNRTCYGSGPYGEAWMSGLVRPAWSTYVRNGYILVFQDVRGKNMSEGTFEDLRPYIVDKRKKQTDEASDTYDTVEWLIHHTHSNQRVGVFGISYPGFYTTMAALSDHPAIRAVSPQAPVTDWFRGDDAHHGGALFLLDMYSFQYWFEHINLPAFWNGTLTPDQLHNPADIIRNDAYTDYLRTGTVSDFNRILNGQCTFWNNLLQHPDLDNWWEQRNVAYHCQEVKPAVMLVGGLFDAEDCFGAFTTYQALRHQSPQTETYLVEGPWAHGEWSRGANGQLGDLWTGEQTVSQYYIDHIEYPFFAYYLEDKGEQPSAPVRIFHTGENQWHEYETWPAPHTRTAYYLSGKELTTEPPAPRDEVIWRYESDPQHPVPFIGWPVKDRPTLYMTSDQRFASARTDVATFSTPTLTRPVSLTGTVEAELYVDISTTDADFVVKLVDVFPDGYQYPDSIANKMRFSTAAGRRGELMGGYQMLVRGEVLRGKYRNSLDFDSVAFCAQRRSDLRGYTFHPQPPQPFTPGKVERLSIKLPDVAHTFLPGHRIMVQIQSSWFPLVDRNPQTFCNIHTCSATDFRPSTVQIHSSSRQPSCIWLPIAR